MGVQYDAETSTMQLPSCAARKRLDFAVIVHTAVRETKQHEVRVLYVCLCVPALSRGKIVLVHVAGSATHPTACSGDRSFSGVPS